MTNVLQILFHNKPIGTITHLSGDKNLFVFDESYLIDPQRPTFSLSLKTANGDWIEEVPATRTRVPPFFSNLLPENPLREYLAKRANVHPQHEFFLLWALGKDLPGSITVEAQDPADFPSLIGSAKEKRPTPLRFSLAGVQLKFSAIQKSDHGWVIPKNGIGGDWILKLPSPIYPGVPENEYTMMELARRIGIDVPATQLHSLETVEDIPPELRQIGGSIYAIRRFDRAEDGARIHIEDFAQIFGLYPEKKYSGASYRNIAETIWKEMGKDGMVEFVKRFIFNALIGNGDMHLKNWSVIYKDRKTPSLAPAYDFVSTLPYLPEDRLALNFVGSKEFSSLTKKQLQRFAEKTNIIEALILETAAATIEAFREEWKNTKDLPLSPALRQTIDQHLKTIPLWTEF